MLYALFQAIAVQATREAEFYQGQPITWALLIIIGGLVGVMYADLKRELSKLWGHGHGISIECHNKACDAKAATEGVMTKEGKM